MYFFLQNSSSIFFKCSEISYINSKELYTNITMHLGICFNQFQ